MSTEGQQSQAQTQTETQASGLLDDVVRATKQTKANRAKELLSAFVDDAVTENIKFDKSVIRTINARIAAIDELLSGQLSEIMHAPEFQKLEGTWRGLHYLVDQSETSAQLKLKVLNCTKRELFKDMDTAVEFDQSNVFKKIYSDQYDMFGGEPYGAMIGDYQFTNHPEDVTLLTKMSGVAASSFAPFITSPGPEFFGYESWTELSQTRDLEKIFDSKEYIQWRAFRDSEDSRYCVMAMPRTLARLPYGENTKKVDEFAYEEVELGKDGKPIYVPHDQYCWMNTAFVLGAKFTEAFAKYGWCTAIRGVEGGGMVNELPCHIFKSDDGDLDQKCPTEIGITERRENELSKLGFMSLCHFKDTDYSVFIGGQTTQKPKKYSKSDATENAAISARLPYIMASSRIAHYLKSIARDKLGGFMERDECEAWLHDWIHDYVAADEKPSAEVKARYPLAAAQVKVTDVPGEPGHYNAVVHLRPWLQFEELSASLRMVTRLPTSANG